VSCDVDINQSEGSMVM